MWRGQVWRKELVLGLGFRRDLVSDLLSYEGDLIDFIELAPENWMGIGGKWKKVLDQAASRYPITCHGLSLSLGSPDPLDFDFLKTIKGFFKEYPVRVYSEHLSFTKCDNAHMHELLPIPFREDAALHVAQRIREAQDFLEQKIAIENVSYYTSVSPEISEQEFISIVLDRANCELLLDVNNAYVNAFNHNYDPKKFISSLPLDRVSYLHIAGHTKKSNDLIIDTHGAPIVDPVYELLAWLYPQVPNTPPVLLERDYDIPPLEELLLELKQIKQLTKANREVLYAA